MLPRVKNVTYSAVMAEQDWAVELAHGVADEVKRLRKERGLSVAKLADRTGELGYPIGASVLTNFEAKRRGSRLDVAELLVLAAALDVPPALLLFPGYPDGGVAYLPGRRQRSRAAVEWVSGNRALRAPDGDEALLGAFPTEMVRRANARQELRQRTGLRFLRAAREFTDDEQAYQDVVDQVAAARQQIAELEEQIRKSGGVIDGGARSAGD